MTENEKILQGWPAHEPSPNFADRVLAACDAPAPARSRKPLLFGAVAAAAALLLFALRPAPAPKTDHATVTFYSDVDLGAPHDSSAP